MYRNRSRIALLVVLLVWPAISSVEAQWVMAARAAKNRIQQMTQKSENGGYDVAIVLLEAPAPKVYERTLKSLQAHTDVNITKNDEKAGRIEIKKEQQVASFQITPLDENLTQFVVASSVGDSSQANTNSKVVDSVLRVCSEVNVKCAVEQN
jgi:type II secretory pathway component HofQ